MPSKLHEKLCAKGVMWLNQNGFSVTQMNIRSAGSREQPDCIGFRQQCSAMIEVKVSRADFIADKNKPERKSGGVGTYRFYLAPAGLISVTELPDRWGLLELSGKTVKILQGATGNLWPSYERAELNGWGKFAHYSCANLERSILFSIARKTQILNAQNRVKSA